MIILYYYIILFYVYIIIELDDIIIKVDYKFYVNIIRIALNN